MEKNLKLFLVSVLLASVAHYLLVLGLSHVTGGSDRFPALAVAILWALSAPMNFVLSSSFGHSLAPAPFQLLFAANSLLWGLLIGGIVSWGRLRHE